MISYLPSLIEPGVLVPRRGHLSAIDVMRDIVSIEALVYPEYQRLDALPADLRDQRLFDEVSALVDPEVADLRRGLLNRRLPDGTLDLTWAINQATGGRWDRLITRDHQTPPPPADDPNEYIYEIHRGYPSHYRYPGIILLPPGRYYIFGTIRLYAGQQLVGASAAEGGTHLVKVGAGPCIRTSHPGNLIDEYEYDVQDMLELYPEGATSARANAQQLRLYVNPYPKATPENAPNLADLLLPEQRECPVSDLLASTAAPTHIANLRISHLESLPGAVPSWALPARFRMPKLRQDAFARPLDAGFRLKNGDPEPGEINTVRWRLEPFGYQCGGIHAINGGALLFEDLVIDGFTQGYGILSHTRSRHGSIYNSQVRRCEIRRCHRGIALSLSLTNGTAETGEDRLTGRTKAWFRADAGLSLSGCNSWTFEDCQVEAFGAAGIDLRGASSTRMVGCRLGPPDNKLLSEDDDARARACLLIAGASCLTYGNVFASAGTHVLYAPFRRPVLGANPSRKLQPGELDQVAPTEPPPAQWWWFAAPPAEEAPLWWTIQLDYSSPGQWLLQNAFRGGDDTESTPRVLQAEYAHDQQVPPLGDGPVPRPVLRPIWASSGGPGSWRATTTDLAAPRTSPESSWSTDNLLCNTRFAGERIADIHLPDHWFWEVNTSRLAELAAPPADITVELEPDYTSPAYSGPVLRVRRVPGAPITTTVIRLVQRVVQSWAPEGETARIAWIGQNLVRGKSLVAACPVWATFDEAARIVMRETPAPALSGSNRENTAGGYRIRGRPYSQVGTWQLLTGFLDPVSRDFPYVVFQGSEKWLWPLDLTVEITPPASPDDVLLIGAPQLSLGPHLLPLGPPRIKLSAPQPANCTPGPIELCRGFEDEAFIDVGNSPVGELILGHDVMLDGLQLDFGRGVEIPESVFMTELVTGNKTMEVAELCCGPAGVRSANRVSLPLPIRRGSVLRLRRVYGPPRPATLVATVVRSKVI